MRHRDRGLPVHFNAKLRKLAALAADIEGGVLSEHGRDTRGDIALAGSDWTVVNDYSSHSFLQAISA